jgi:DNA uptake protein ComE-like DNA-binding protein
MRHACIGCVVWREALVRWVHRHQIRAMPTTAERQALAFLAGVALLGGSVQVWRHRSARTDSTTMIQASGTPGVEAQLHAVDSLRASRSNKKKPARKTSRSPDSMRVAGTLPPPEAPLLVDVDVASASELEQLPRVGPALAARIVADRDSLGAFGSLQEFGRVRGIGPAMLKLLEPVTTFSGRTRSPSRSHRDW